LTIPEALPPPPRPLGAKTGFTYSQTISLLGVTSKKRPGAPSQISVLPLGSRWAPIDRTIEFILESQARSEAKSEVRLQKLEELEEESKKRGEEIDTRIAELTRNVEGLVTVAESHHDRIAALDARVDSVATRIDNLGEMFERWIRNQGGSNGNN
jgi:hypothetical protein